MWEGLDGLFRFDDTCLESSVNLAFFDQDSNSRAPSQDDLFFLYDNNGQGDKKSSLSVTVNDLLGQTIVCLSQSCDAFVVMVGSRATNEDCTLSAFSSFSECGCDGQQSQTRTILAPASSTGKKCSEFDLVNTRTCTAQPGYDLMLRVESGVNIEDKDVFDRTSDVYVQATVNSVSQQTVGINVSSLLTY